MTIIIEQIKAHLESQQGPRYRRIAQAIAAAVDAGDIEAGVKLPTHRALAEALGFSVQTVSFAYAHAQQQGYAYGKVGSGTYVGHRKAEREADFLKADVNGGSRVIDLSIARAVAGPEQERAFAQTLTEIATSRDGVRLINSIKPFAGLPEHRDAARHWLRGRGIQVPQEQVCICNGVTHGLLIALSSLVKPGGMVACEALVDHGLISLARTLNFKLEGVAIDAEGMIPEALEQCCQHKQIDALCLTPTLHNPTTATMGDPRRRAIAEIAQRYGVPLVEDDVFGPLVADRHVPVSSYLPDSSYYLTSFTKTLASGLRVGYLVPPRGAVSQVVGRLRASSWMASPMTVDVVSRWIREGTAERLLSWQRDQLARRQQLAAKVLAGHAYQANPQGPLLWLTLPEAWRSEAFITQAKVRNLSLTAAEPFAVGHQSTPNQVRISLASAVSEAQLKTGLEILATLLRETPPPSVNDDDIL
ncbi:MAG: PLP-dependent aminotransferase family protein [Motiliproteus sp.]